MHMNAWEYYLMEKVDEMSGRHKEFPLWTVAGVWEFIRDDGLHTAHKIESPFCSWRRTVEESMALADAMIPLGSTLPKEMRTREDPDYGPLWDKRETRKDQRSVV